MSHHPAGRWLRVAAGQKVAAMMSLKVAGASEDASAMLMDFTSTPELTLGFQAVIEQLATELGTATERTPSEVLSDVALMCARVLAHPDPAPPDVVD